MATGIGFKLLSYNKINTSGKIQKKAKRQVYVPPDKQCVLSAESPQAGLTCSARRQIVDNLCRFSEMTEQEHIKILEDFRTGGIDQMVETWMLNYLANNQYHLPMYAREGTAEALKIKKDSGLDPASISLAASRGRIT